MTPRTRPPPPTSWRPRPGSTPAVIGIVGILEPLVNAYRTGGGVPYADFGAGIRHGIGGMNRPMFTNELATWVAAVPGLVERLHRPGARALRELG